MDTMMAKSHHKKSFQEKVAMVSKVHDIELMLIYIYIHVYICLNDWDMNKMIDDNFL